jgi:hypothetical protein
MITTQEMIGFLIGMKFDEELVMGNPARQRRNDVIDKIIMIVGSHVSKEEIFKPENEDLMADPDCPGGVCPVR